MATATVTPTPAPLMVPQPAAPASEPSQRASAKDSPTLHASDSPRSSNTSSVQNEKVGLSSAQQNQRAGSGHSSEDRKRWKTFRKSFKYLRDLTPRQVDDFMASYVIYNLDWEDESQMVEALGPDYQKKVGDCLKSYYGVMNHLCALGDVEKMYIPPLMSKSATVLQNQLLNEESIAQEIGLKAGDKVLDLGCGRGRVAAHMTSYTGAQVTGLNIDPNQIAQAREFNTEVGFRNEFVEHDQNELPLPFADASFDAFYEVQALSLCKDPRELFKEVYRTLKPGAKFALMDWVSLPPYDPENHEHLELMRRVKPLIGAVGTPTPASFEAALTEAGFKVIKSDNPSIDEVQYPLIDKVDIYFRSLRKAIKAAVAMRMLPKHFKTLIDRLCLDGQAFVKMDKMRLITTVWRVIAEKPME